MENMFATIIDSYIKYCGMIKPIKHDKSAKHKKSKALKSNIAVHPFVMVSILAALVTVILAITFFWLRFL